MRRLQRADLFFCLLVMLTSNASAQSDDTQETPEPFVQQYSDADFVDWEFGVRIGCTEGTADKVIVNAPVPIEWPEQEVELYEEKKTNNIGKITIKKLGKGSSYFAFKVPRINNQGTAEVILRYRVKRRSTLLPEDTDQFVFATKFNARLKAFLKPSPYIESKDEQIRSIGGKILAETSKLPPWEQVEAIYDWVRENVKYKFDTQIHSCAEALARGHGDCEELSSLFIAICRSQSIPARAVWVPGHTYPEFYLEDATGKGHWFPCQIAGARHEFGEMSETRPILQKGDRFKPPVAGKIKRYNSAALRAASSTTGSLSIEQIIREVGDE